MKTTFDDLAKPEPYVMGPNVDHIRYGDKFIEEYDTEELRAAYVEHLGPCRCCGQIGCPYTAAISREELVAIWTADRRLQESIPVTNARFDNIARAGLCEKCIAMHKKERNAAMKQEKIRKLRVRLSGMGIVPPEFAKCSFMDSEEHIMLKNPETWEWARSWTPKSEAAWIFGDRGTGKTFLARCILNAQLDAGVSVGELSAVKFNQNAKRRFYDWHKERETYGKVRVLLIEDIDKAVWTLEGLSELYSLLDERHSNERRTFVTTNATIEWCTAQWKDASAGNESLPGTIKDRLKPIRRIEFAGPTLREGGQSEYS